jgi:ZIP family zinc transporter
MVEQFINLHPVLQALIATLFTWALTALGASSVFLAKTINQKVLDGMLGFAAGVYWSLLAPAIRMSEDGPLPAWIPALIGFLTGGIVLRISDILLPHLHIGFPAEEAEGPQTNWRRTTLLILAITIHNFPEGLAIGVAFGAVAAELPAATISGAVALAIGIGIQNFPEGLAVSMPLRREGLSRFKSFFYGQLSAVVEPIAGVLGAAAVLISRPLLPYALSFAAGAMIFVVVEEVLPESQRQGNTDIATIGVMIGFAVMMTLDVAFG